MGCERRKTGRDEREGRKERDGGEKYRECLLIVSCSHLPRPDTAVSLSSTSIASSCHPLHTWPQLETCSPANKGRSKVRREVDLVFLVLRGDGKCWLRDELGNR